MVRKETLLKVFFIYLCSCHLVSGQSCGISPLRKVKILSIRLGQSVDTLMNRLQLNNPAAYAQLNDEWRRYDECQGLAETGYFKRSLDDTQGGAGSEAGPLARSQDGGEGLAADDLLDRALQSWMDTSSDSVRDLHSGHL